MTTVTVPTNPKEPTMNTRPVLITTVHRGVFGGLINAATDVTQPTITNITEARMAIRWGTTDGVMQLAHTGPTSNSKISAPATISALSGITAVFDITEEAWAKWSA